MAAEGEGAAEKQDQPHLSDDCLAAVLRHLHWEDFGSVCLAGRQLHACLCREDVRLEIARRNVARYSFFPTGYVVPSWEVFVKRALPLLQEFRSLQAVLLEKHPEHRASRKLDQFCEIYGAVEVQHRRETRSSMGSSIVKLPRHIVDRARGLGSIVTLDLDELTESQAIIAHGLFPRQGKMYFLGSRDDCIVYHDDGLETDRKPLPTVQIVPRNSLDVLGTTDTLFVQDFSEWKDEELRQTLEDWNRTRSDPYFQDGHFPPENYIRLGGSQVFDGQGNFVIDSKTDRVLLQSSHQEEFGWFSFGFYMNKEDHAKGNWEAAGVGVVDDA